MAIAPANGSLMDGIYRHQRHIYDFTRRYYLLGRDRLIADLRPSPGGTVLEIGCGTARNLIAAARLYPEARLFGIDISSEMLRSARHMVERNGLDRRIMLARGDATGFDAGDLFGVEGFDRILFSYSLSMIPGWTAALSCAIAKLAPGGQLHIVDFGDQRGLPVWFRRALKAWLARFHVTPRLDLDAELERLAIAHGGLTRSRRLYRDYAVLAVWQKD
ncbi:S-adenosylmethionine-diacylgycerolhomoserine-N-methyltransferase [Hoeflea marina]|uniref:S-adenosylmethionine-diacylgycerolhomoserine-N-methyltransferase n=1 Tax=Hoeflea marina TaxID=274592 RepID=A0A317PI59_9HYPH|nr:class I SAM-dependent methyltransferase [Hoeflea marina]PWV98897.1 S-adenosylmethionine-diacylgycerolhomoserine-N-methyltransferase [Hoeflea marina]